MWDLDLVQEICVSLTRVYFVVVKGAYKCEKKSVLELLVAERGLHGCGRGGTDNAWVRA